MSDAAVSVEDRRPRLSGRLACPDRRGRLSSTMCSSSATRFGDEPVNLEQRGLNDAPADERRGRVAKAADRHITLLQRLREPTIISATPPAISTPLIAG